MGAPNYVCFIQAINHTHKNPKIKRKLTHSKRTTIATETNLFVLFLFLGVFFSYIKSYLKFVAKLIIKIDL